MRAEDGIDSHIAPRSPASPAFSTSSTFEDEGGSSPILPSLPSPQISRRARELLRTPPPADNSQYYTASWGSPYEQPVVTEQSRRPHTLRRQHSEESPVRHLEFHTPFLRPAPTFTRSQTDPDFVSQDGLISAAVLANRARRPAQGLTEDWIRQHTGGESAENNAWLSDDPDDSEHSSLSGSLSGKSGQSFGEEADQRTPTVKRFLEIRQKLRNPFAIPPRRNSTATLKQEDFSDAVLPTMSTEEDYAVTSPMGNENSTIDEEGAPAPPPKELADWNPAAVNALEKMTSIIKPGSPAPGPPRLKKKVPWKGKNIMVLLPRDVERGNTGNAPTPMTREDVQAKMTEWEDQGYNTSGFTVEEDDNFGPEGGSGQSRGIWPEAADVEQERQQRSFKVSIPNRRGKSLLNLQTKGF